ncbi:MAG: DUF1822 family protein [Calothrix sp. C42_A2020_038]|nr:DUF1822 family protein [Calothrix sp. C42_A2020_038]
MVFLFDVTQLELEISPSLSQQLWQQSQLQSAAVGQWNTYLNQVCLQTFLPWLRDEYELEANVIFDQPLSVWSVLNGSILTLGNKRLVLIPDKSLDNNEYVIPQEWVDVPQFHGDYYLAVQINPDELYMRVWGYTTHKQIKTKGYYNAINRTYSLDAHDIIPDLNVLWVVSQLNPNEETRVAIASLPPIPATQAENLLLRLANPGIIQPRLELPFSLWGQLVSNENWRQRLYQLRQEQSQSSFAPQKVVANLTQWLQNTFEEGWQSLDSLFGTSTSLGLSLRRTEAGDVAIKRGKSLNLPDGEAFLILELDRETDGRLGIRIQLRKRSQEEYLPPQTNLILLSSSGQIIQTTQSRTQDNIIQLKRFRSPANTQFIIRIEVDDFAVTEDFVI